MRSPGSDRGGATRSHELFTLNVLLATLLFAWLTKQAGLSMELGAFVAGMLISETEFRYQVEEDIKPFRDVLLGLFFVARSACSSTSSRGRSTFWPRVLLLLVVPLVIKFGAGGFASGLRVFGACTGARRSSTGIWLAQAGEFAIRAARAQR